MTGSEKLLRAIGEIDEVMIADAALPYSPFKRFRQSAPMIAASLIVCIAAVIALARFLPAFGPAGDATNMNNGMTGDAGENDGNSSHPTGDASGNTGENGGNAGLTVLPGTVFASNNGTITYHGIEGNSISITLENYNDLSDKIIFCIYLSSSDGEMHCITNGDIGPKGLKISVSGTETGEIPTESGTHEVKIDLSTFIELGYTFDHVIVFNQYK